MASYEKPADHSLRDLCQGIVTCAALIWAARAVWGFYGSGYVSTDAIFIGSAILLASVIVARGGR